MIRHATREPIGDFADYKNGDLDAEITKQGEIIATGAGEWLAQNGEIPSVIYVSPAVRTQQTAECIVKAIEDAGFVPPDIKVDVGIGPFMSVRGLILKIGTDDSQKRVGIVSHHETIRMGLQALQIDNETDEEIDNFAEGEVRILRIKRKTGKWSEEQRIRPSDVGLDDVY